VVRRLGIALGLSCILGVAASGLAQEIDELYEDLGDAPFTITADEISYEEEREVYEAAGNVRVERVDGRSLSADWMAFSARTRIGVATGNVTIRDGLDTLTAEFATVDLETLTALATDATLDSPQTGFLVKAGALRKTGPDTFEVERGNFTTCRCPPGERRPWEIDVGEADVRVQGYAVSRDVTFRVLGWPVAYAPWLILPVKTDRQSGLLMPELELSSEDGLQIELPFFWAVRPDLNVLLRPRWIQDRGVKYGAEYEFVFGESAYSDGGFAILPGDNDVEDNDPKTPFSDNRWAYWLRHHHPLGPGQVFGADVKRISDNNYLFDFNDFAGEVESERVIESRAWASMARGFAYAGIQGDYFDDLESPNNLDRDHYLLQRAPDVRLSGLPLPIGGLPLLASLDARYTHFYQQANESILRGNPAIRGQFFDTGPDGTFDFDEPTRRGDFSKPPVDNHLDNFPLGGEGDGRYQEGELLADQGNRVDLFPRLSMPVQVGMFEALGELGWRGTLYDARRATGQSRTLVTARLDARTRLQRGFRVAGLDLQHVVEPGAGYAFVSDQSQKRNPLFLPKGAIPQERLVDSDPRLLSRDPSDRIEEQRFLHFSVQNRFFAATPVAASSGGQAPPREVASLRLGSGYDFELGRQSNVYLASTLEPTEQIRLDFDVGYDFKEEVLDELLAGVSLRVDGEFSFSADYRYVRDVPFFFEDFPFADGFRDFEEVFDRINQLGLAGTYQIHPRLELFGNGYFSLEDGSTNGGRFGGVLTSACKCWDLIASVRRSSRRGDWSLEVAIELTGLGFGAGGR
jgi:lipopolysaccharide assembly outer membrane protein LptD (OstA)